MKKMKNIPRSLKIVLAVSLLIHIAGLVFVLSAKGIDPLIIGDAHDYTGLAQHLRLGLGFTHEDMTPDVFRTPGLPILLYPFVGSSAGFVVYFFLLTTAASILLPYLTWWIGKRLFNERVALFAAIVCAFEPMLIFFSWFALTEIPFLIFSLLAIATFIRALEFRSTDRSFYIFAAAAGFFSGFAVLIRPGNLLLFICGGVLLLLWNIKNRRKFIQICVIGLVMMATLLPWCIRVHSITGTYSLSGAGWRNVYTDYLPSIRSLKNGSDFSFERGKIRNIDSASLGLTNAELDDPKNAKLLEEYSIHEIMGNIPTVLKLEPTLLFTFFINDGYYYQASRLGFMPRLPSHISPTRLFLDNKFAALGRIFEQLRGQLFVPLIGHIITFFLFVLALIGLFQKRYPGAFLFGAVIALAALAASALGFGVEARLRISIMPILFLVAGVGYDLTLSAFYKLRSKRASLT